MRPNWDSEYKREKMMLFMNSILDSNKSMMTSNYYYQAK